VSYGLWLSAAGLQTNEYRQSLTANNLANVETVGFKRDLAVLRERQVESAADPQQQSYSNPLLDAMSGGTWVRPTYTSFEQGSIEHTGGEHDLAISGDGFFAVSDGNTDLYTRDGRFTRDPVAGELVMVAGDGRYRLLDEAGHAIAITDAELGPVNIAKDGTISQGGTILGKLALVDFEDRTLLRKTGAGLLEYQGSDRPNQGTGVILSGYLEGSTVDPATELINMIEVTRAYELNARMLALQDETIGLAVQRVGLIS